MARAFGRFGLALCDSNMSKVDDTEMITISMRIKNWRVQSGDGKTQRVVDRYGLLKNFHSNFLNVLAIL